MQQGPGRGRQWGLGEEEVSQDLGRGEGLGGAEEARGKDALRGAAKSGLTDENEEEKPELSADRFGPDNWRPRLSLPPPSFLDPAFAYFGT